MKIVLTDIEESHLETLSKKVRERWQYVRVRSILLSHRGWSGLQIGEILGIDESTVYEYQHRYVELGLDSYLERDYKGYLGQLDSHQISILREELKGRLYQSSQEVLDFIRNTFSIEYSESGATSLLHRIGFSYKKTKQVPCEANREKQEAFVELIEEKLAAQEAENSVIYFTDGVHPSHNTRSTYGWIETGKEFELQTVSGRDRININGAINPQNPTEIHTVIDETVNAQSTIKLFEKILEANPNKDKIYVFSDNAAYYRSKILKEWELNNPKIVHLFLPPYSPNLNPIERLWKFMRNKTIDTIFYRTKELFRAGIDSFFKNTAQFQDQLQSLITLNFHLFGLDFNL